MLLNKAQIQRHFYISEWSTNSKTLYILNEAQIQRHFYIIKRSTLKGPLGVLHAQGTRCLWWSRTTGMKPWEGRIRQLHRRRKALPPSYCRIASEQDSQGCMLEEGNLMLHMHLGGRHRLSAWYTGRSTRCKLLIIVANVVVSRHLGNAPGGIWHH